LETTPTYLREQAREYVRAAQFTTYPQKESLEALAVKALDEAKKLDELQSNDGDQPMVDVEDFDGTGHA
jgi:hypothetical protein